MEKEKEEKKYLELIIKILKGEEKINLNENIKEINLKLDSNIFYTDAWNYLSYHNNSRVKCSEQDKYFIESLIDIIKLLCETLSNKILNSEFLKLIIFILVKFFISPFELSNELIFDLFYGFYDLLTKIKDESNIIIEINNFEGRIFDSMKKSLNKFFGDYDTYLAKINIDSYKIENINDINELLRDIIIGNPYIKMPLYIKGFMDYKSKIGIEKYIIIKIFNYLEKIDKKIDRDLNDYLNTGYALYSIISKKKRFSFNLKDFDKLQLNRLKNIEALNILKLSIKLLKSKDIKELNKLFQEQIIKKDSKEPTISDNFNNTDEYYKELYSHLIHSLKEYTENPSKICYPLKNDKIKCLWISYLEILLISLEESQLEEKTIKIIFYFIVNIFTPDLDTDSLEFRDDAVPLFVSQSFEDQLFLFEHQEIYKLLDEYSEYYLDSNIDSKFEEEIIDNSYSSLNKISNFSSLKKKYQFIEGELKHLKAFEKKFKLSLLFDYMSDFPHINFQKPNYANLAIKTLYKKVWYYLGDEKDKKNLLTQHPKNINENNDMENDINSIIQNNDYIQLIKNIMNSPVIKEAYEEINEWYISKENEYLKEKNKNEKIIDTDIKISTKKRLPGALINEKTIKYYYDEFCKELDKINYNDIFIVMNLPERIKGFTFRYIKIVFNCNGIKFHANNDNNRIKLLKAYLVFVIMNEQKHIIKSYFNIGVTSKLCNTPKIGDIKEGGEQLIKFLFGSILIENSINTKQAEYILNLKNWQKPLNQFREDFLAIKKDKNNNCSSIIYLSSNNCSICDHSKLFN